MPETVVHLRPARVLTAAAASESPPRAADLPAEWADLPSGVIDGGEIVLLAIKPSMWRPLFDSAPWLLMAGVFSTMIILSRAALPGMTPSGSAQLVLAIGFVRLIIAIVRWIATWYVLTNRRIMDVRGARSPRIGSLPLVDIRNTYLNSSVAERVVRVGTILFLSKHTESERHFWQSVPKPEFVHAKIRRAIENALDNYGL